MTRPRTIVLGLCVLALYLRTQAIGYGLPAVYNMDEVAIMNRALSFGTGTLNPGNFLYPTFYFYLLFAWQGLTFIAGLALGLWDSLAAFEQRYFVDPSPLFVSGRLLSALCGTLTVAAVYRIGARLADPWTGMIAAALLAVAPFAVQDAHYVKHDVPVTLLIVLVPLALTSASRHRVLLAGAAAGLAMSTHYYAVFITAAIAAERLTAVDHPWNARVTSLGKAALIAAAVFLLASPFLLPEWRTALTDITQNRAIVMDRATGAVGLFGYLGAYLRWLAGAALGGPVALLAVVGLVVCWRARWQTAVMLLVFPVLFLLFIANTVPATRYVNPVLPFVALLAAWAVRAAGRWVRPAVATTALTVVVMSAGLVDSISLGRFFQQDDTRTLAARWFAEQVPAGDTVLLQPYSVPLRRSQASLAEALRTHLGDESRASVRFQRELAAAAAVTVPPQYRVLFLGDGGLDVDKIYLSPTAVDEAGTLAPLRARGVRWVVLKRYNVANPSLASLDLALARDGRLMHTFSPYDPAAGEAIRAEVAPFEHNEDGLRHAALVRPGPVIEIWRVD